MAATAKRNKHGYTQEQQRTIDRIKAKGGTIPIGLFMNADTAERIDDRMRHLRSASVTLHGNPQVRRDGGYGKRQGSRSARRRAAANDGY